MGRKEYKYSKSLWESSDSKSTILWLGLIWHLAIYWNVGNSVPNLGTDGKLEVPSKRGTSIMLVLTQLYTYIHMNPQRHCSYSGLQLGRDSASAVERNSRAVHKCTGTATQEQARPGYILWGSNATQRHTSPDSVTK